MAFYYLYAIRETYAGVSHLWIAVTSDDEPLTEIGPLLLRDCLPSSYFRGSVSYYQYIFEEFFEAMVIYFTLEENFWATCID